LPLSNIGGILVLSVQIPRFKKSFLGNWEHESLLGASLDTFARSIYSIVSIENVDGLKEIAINTLKRADDGTQEASFLIDMAISQNIPNFDEKLSKSCFLLDVASLEIETDEGNFDTHLISSELKKISPLPRQMVEYLVREKFRPMFDFDELGDLSHLAKYSLLASAIYVRIIYERESIHTKKEFQWINEHASALCAEFIMLCSLIDISGWPKG
jgi:hypothetical protein